MGIELIDMYKIGMYYQCQFLEMCENFTYFVRILQAKKLLAKAETMN